MDYSKMTLKEVLRTYSSVKGHRTRCERKIQSLIALLKVQYSAWDMHQWPVGMSRKTHTQTQWYHRLFIDGQYTRAKDHKDKVTEFFAVLEAIATEIFTVIHERHAAILQAAIVVQAVPAPARSPPKPSAELKPEKLSNEATMASFWTWKKQFRAY